MKIAFISDIHGNYDALKKVLIDIRKKKIDKIYCLGDIINYYYEPHKCIDAIIKNKIDTISGNHEKIFFKIKKNKNKLIYFKKLYGKSIEINTKKLKNRHINFLKKLKNQMIIKIKNKKILLVHGSPWKNNFYFYANTKKKWFNKILKYNYDVIIMGHTHYPMKIKIYNKVLANPGSVGQPRNNTNDANWLQLNTNTMQFVHKTTRYNKDKILRQIRYYDKNNNKLLKYFIK